MGFYSFGSISRHLDHANLASPFENLYKLKENSDPAKPLFNCVSCAWILNRPPPKKKTTRVPASVGREAADSGIRASGSHGSGAPGIHGSGSRDSLGPGIQGSRRQAAMGRARGHSGRHTVQVFLIHGSAHQPSTQRGTLHPAIHTICIRPFQHPAVPVQSISACSNPSSCRPCSARSTVHSSKQLASRHPGIPPSMDTVIQPSARVRQPWVRRAMDPWVRQQGSLGPGIRGSRRRAAMGQACGHSGRHTAQVSRIRGSVHQSSTQRGSLHRASMHVAIPAS